MAQGFSEYTPKIEEESVAVTDLFSLANQYSRQVIQPHTDQSAGRVQWFHLPLKNYFSSPFWKSATEREHTASREERPLSCSLPRDTPALTIFTEDNYCYSYTLKKIPCGYLLHTKELMLWYCCYLTPQKNFSYPDTSLFSVIKINHLLLFFKEVLLFCSARHK